VHVSGLFVYPIKSCAAVAVSSRDLDPRGLAGDRQYMVVDAAGTFLTQREAPALATVAATLNGGLRVATPAGSAAAVPGATRTVTVWEHTGPALDCGDEVADLLSTHLGRPCRLVKLADEHDRPTVLGGGHVGFSDGYPLLITSESSLADLNARLPQRLPMNRFRPNIVVTGAPAFDEDHWERLLVGEVGIDVVKPCARCAITRVDQVTGVRGDGEPLRTLGTFRKAEGGVMFGQNAVHRGVGRLRVGDPVSVTARRR
jgi:hypothetical protein